MTPPPAQHVCSPLLQLPHSGLVFRCGDGRPLTGGQVRRVVASWAHVLRGATCALRPGEVVAVAAGTSAQFVLAWLAVTAAGGVAALLNTKWCAAGSGPGHCCVCVSSERNAHACTRTHMACHCVPVPTGAPQRRLPLRAG